MSEKEGWLVRQWWMGGLLATLLLAACSTTVNSGSATSTATSSATSPVTSPVAGRLPRVRHVFVVNLENKSFATTFGARSPAPYLSRTLTSRGMLLRQFFGIAHNSLPNYLAQISGQAPNRATQGDCGRYSAFVQTGTAVHGQAIGQGCVYPASVPTLAGQLDAAGFSWRGYLEDMGSSCRHPVLGGPDTSHTAKVGDQYATRHDPFVYFRSIPPATCRRNVVDLSHLRADLSSRRTTRNLSYVTPDLCDDGHDSPCVDGRPGGLSSADLWLRTWIPRILASPAFREDGLLVVTFDEAETGHSDSSEACCGEQPGPNTSAPGITGPGGGRIGAVLVSRFVTAGSHSDVPYDQYSLLRTIEDLFGLPALGFAGTTAAFGREVWNRS